MRRLRIATWNTRVDFGSPGDRAEWRARALARALDRLHADVVALQEIESQALLDRVNGSLRRPFEVARVVVGNSLERMHQGFLSRHPVRCVSHRGRLLTATDGTPLCDFASSRATRPSLLCLRRDALLAELSVPGIEPIWLLNLHLKSKRGSHWGLEDSETIRRAEARAVAEIVEGHPALRGRDARLVVIGDLNARRDDPTIAPVASKLGLDDVLEREWVQARREPAYTYHRLPHRGRIDAILLSPTLRRLYLRDSARIHRNADTRRASDHFPASIDLRC